MPLLKDFSIQLYSLRTVINDDYDGKIRELGRIGFTGVEFANEFGGHSAGELRKLLDGCGMRTVSAHVGADLLTTRLDEQIEFFGELGAEYIVLPGYDMKIRADVMALAGLAGPAARKIRAAGMKFGYHNHAHEFKKDGDEFLLDILWENTDPSDLVAQLDIAWVAYAGVDPIAYMRKLGPRAEMLHLKQLAAYGSPKQADLGDGVIDFRAVILAGRETGVKHYILEQEEYPVDPMTSVANGFRHIMSL